MAIIEKQYKRVDTGEVVLRERINTTTQAFADELADAKGDNKRTTSLQAARHLAETGERSAMTLGSTTERDRRYRWEQFTAEEKAAMQRAEPERLQAMLQDYRERKGGHR
jgi:hypothetical protein